MEEVNFTNYSMISSLMNEKNINTLGLILQLGDLEKECDLANGALRDLESLLTN